MADLPPEAKAFKEANRERTRRAIASVVEDAVRAAGVSLISVAKVRAAGASDQNAATTLLRLWRAGTVSVADLWTDQAVAAVAAASSRESERAQLAERIRAAETDGDREALAQEVAALVAAGALDPDEASQIKSALAEARLSAEAKRASEPPPEDPRKLLLASAEALTAARAIDWMVDDARRDRVLAFIATELEADRVDHPNEDEGA